jgi:hypothetical protein
LGHDSVEARPRPGGDDARRGAGCLASRGLKAGLDSRGWADYAGNHYRIQIKPERGETRERSDDRGGADDEDLALCGDGLELDQPIVAHERIRRQYSAALRPLPAHRALYHSPIDTPAADVGRNTAPSLSSATARQPESDAARVRRSAP